MGCDLKELGRWQVELGGHGAALVEGADEADAVRRYFGDRGILASDHPPAVEPYPYRLPED